MIGWYCCNSRVWILICDNWFCSKPINSVIYWPCIMPGCAKWIIPPCWIMCWCIPRAFICTKEKPQNLHILHIYNTIWIHMDNSSTDTIIDTNNDTHILIDVKLTVCMNPIYLLYLVVWDYLGLISITISLLYFLLFLCKI